MPTDPIPLLYPSPDDPSLADVAAGGDGDVVTASHALVGTSEEADEGTERTWFEPEQRPRKCWF